MLDLASLTAGTEYTFRLSATDAAAATAYADVAVLVNEGPRCGR